MAAEDNLDGSSTLARKRAALNRSAAAVQARLSTALGRWSPKAHLALSAGLLAALLLGLSAYLLTSSATLKLVCHHYFRSADITVSIDGDVVHKETLAGAVKKWFGVLEKAGGTYTRTIPVSSGRRLVEVRLRAPGYDHTRKLQVDFIRGQESTLSVDSARDLSLVWLGTGGGAGGTESGRDSAPWFKYAASILMTILGSILSAAIGAFVQDFIRSRKTRLDVPKEAHRESSEGVS